MKNFKDIMELQAKQPVQNLRERNIDDILTSIVAECIEFNEETMNNHKTWVIHEYNSDNELEELCDVYMFFAEFLNSGFNEETVYIKTFEEFKQGSFTTILSVITEVACGMVFRGFEHLITLTRQYGYTKEDILNGCLKKYEKNKSREDWR